MSLFQEACAAVGPLRVTVQHEDGRPTDHREFAQPFLVIGREPKMDLPLNDLAVSYRHAYLQVIAGQVFCIDLFTRSGTRWGGGQRPAGWLAPDESIGVGPFTVQLRDAPPSGPTETADPMASRSQTHDPLPAVSLEIPLENQTVVWQMNRVLALVGLEPRCKVHLKAKGVSAVHCSLLRTPKGLWVVDLQSTTGTTVNGTSVRWACLADGDELRVGEMRLRVKYHSDRNPVVPSSTSNMTRSGVFVQSLAEEEKLRSEVDELNRALAAAEEDRAGLIRANEEASKRWEAERLALQQERETEAQTRQTEQQAAAEHQARLEAERQRTDAELATARQELDAERQRHQDQVAALQATLATAQEKLTTTEQQGQAELATVRTQADQDHLRLIAETNILRAELEGTQTAAATQLQHAAEKQASTQAEFERERQTLQDEVATLRQEVIELGRRSQEDVAGAVGVFDRQRQALRDEVDRLERETENLRSERDQAAAQLDTVRAERDALRGELVAARTKAETEEQGWRRELTTAREELMHQQDAANAERQRYEQERSKAHADHDHELRTLRNTANTLHQELAALRKQLETARADAANQVQQREDELAAARLDFDRERQTLTAELKQIRQEAEERGAKLEMEEAQMVVREREYYAKLSAAEAELARQRQALRAEADGLRSEGDALRAELEKSRSKAAATQQQSQTELVALRTKAEQETQRLAAEVESARRTVKTLRAELTVERSLTANLQSNRQTLQDEAVAQRQEYEILLQRFEAIQHEYTKLTVIEPDPALAKLTDQFRLAADRFTALIAQIESAFADLRERSQRPPERRGLLARLRGASREEQAETNAALERRLATLRSEATIELERTALLAAEAARVDLERQLEEARRQLQARSDQ